MAFVTQNNFDELARGLASGRLSRGQVLKGFFAGALLATPLGALWERRASAQLVPECTQEGIDACEAAAQQAYATCARRCRRLDGRRKKRCARKCKKSLATRKLGCQCVPCSGLRVDRIIWEDPATGALIDRGVGNECGEGSWCEDLCARANQDSRFVKLMRYLLQNGFAVDGDPKPEFWSHRYRDLSYSGHLIARYAKGSTGEEALLQYAGDDAQIPGVFAWKDLRTFALVTKNSVLQYVLSVDDDGTVEKELPSSPGTAAFSKAALDGAEVEEVGADTDTSVVAAALGEPTEGDYACEYCELICNAVVEAPCLILAGVLAKSPRAARAAGPVCAVAAFAVGNFQCKEECKKVIRDETRLDEMNCGACGIVCAAGVETCCNGTCVDVRTDERYCGGCFQAPCGPSQICCDGLCRTPQTNPQHCGTCGNRCEPEQTCRDGVCRGRSCTIDNDCPGLSWVCCEGECRDESSAGVCCQSVNGGPQTWCPGVPETEVQCNGCDGSCCYGNLSACRCNPH